MWGFPQLNGLYLPLGGDAKVVVDWSTFSWKASTAVWKRCTCRSGETPTGGSDLTSSDRIHKQYFNVLNPIEPAAYLWHQIFQHFTIDQQCRIYRNHKPNNKTLDVTQKLCMTPSKWTPFGWHDCLFWTSALFYFLFPIYCLVDNLGSL